jgi:hypothetical protein
VSRPALDYVLAVNDRLVYAGYDEVAFRRDNATPHITYFMGTVPDVKALGRIEETMASYAADISLATYGLRPPGRPRDNEHSAFVFAEVIPADQFVAERRLLEAHLKQAMKFEKFGGTLNTPHVTVGYCADNTVLEQVIQLWPAYDVVSERHLLAVSVAGNRGVAMQRLASFDVSRTQ